MHPDPAGPLALAAARRHELTRARAIQALRELDRAGAPVTFAAVATAAGISRSWLYTQPDTRSRKYPWGYTYVTKAPGQALAYTPAGTREGCHERSQAAGLALRPGRGDAA